MTAVRHRRASHWRDLAAAGAALALVAAAFIVPHLGNKTITPLINSSPAQIRDFAEAAPLFARWNVHIDWWTPVALLIAVATVVWGPALAQRLRWRTLTLSTWLLSASWAMSLAMVDGWQRGFVDRLTSGTEYLHEVPGITDVPQTLSGFSSRILAHQPDSWTTHVSGHPPGALLTFVGLDRLGLSGGAWASALCVLVGSSAAAAVLVGVRALGDEAMARRAAPFVALAPTAIWIAASADAIFAGVAAWGLALLALSAASSIRHRGAVAVAAGLVLGFGIFLNYGLVLMGIPALAVLVIARNYRPLWGATAGALFVVAVFALLGFWWFDGYLLVQERYWQGIANDRPFAYWGWANFASLICAVGLAVPAALPRVFTLSALRARRPVNVLVVACLIVVVAADLSALSKAETERIWLPFEVWLLAAAALLPIRGHRVWLAAQAAAALLINHLLLTNW